MCSQSILGLGFYRINHLLDGSVGPLGKRVGEYDRVCAVVLRSATAALLESNDVYESGITQFVSVMAAGVLGTIDASCDGDRRLQ